MTSISFMGPWRADERHTLRDAINEVEQFLNIPVPAGFGGPVWECQRVCEASGDVFAVSRMNIDRVLWDHNILGLIKQIYRLTWERG